LTKREKVRSVRDQGKNRWKKNGGKGGNGTPNRQGERKKGLRDCPEGESPTSGPDIIVLSWRGGSEEDSKT